MNKISSSQDMNGKTLSQRLDPSCLKRLYRLTGNLSADARRAGILENAIPLELLNSDRDEYIERVLEELIRQDALPSLFVLAILEWSNDEELLSVIKQIVAEKAKPSDAAPIIWTGMQTTDQRKLKKIWSDFCTSIETPIQIPAHQTIDKSWLIKNNYFNELAQCFREENEIKTLLYTIKFPQYSMPNFGIKESLSWWMEICEKIDKGCLECDNSTGFRQLLKAAAKELPGNPKFKSFLEFVNEGLP